MMLTTDEIEVIPILLDMMPTTDGIEFALSMEKYMRERKVRFLFDRIVDCARLGVLREHEGW